MAKFLMIAFVFPPVGGTQGVWMKGYIKEILRQRHGAIEIDVLTIDPSRDIPQYDPGLMHGLERPEVRIIRVNPGYFHRLRYRRRSCGRADGGRVGCVAGAVNFLSNVAWAVPAVFHILKSRLRAVRYDGIYVFADPIVSLAVGVIARAFHGGRMVIEYGDPWRIKPSTLKKTAAVRFAGGILESFALGRCDLIIFKTGEIITEYAKFYPHIPRERYDVLYGAVNYDEHDRLPAPPARRDRFVICHTGLIYPDSASPEPFLDGVRLLREQGVDVEVVMLGDIQPALRRLVCDRGIESSFTFAGHRPYNETLACQKASTVLMAFGFSTPFKIPSKIAQYAASRRPILLVAGSENDPSAGFVRLHGCGIAVRNTAEAICAAVANMHAMWKEGRLYGAFSTKDIPEITYSFIVSRILTGLERNG